MNDVIVTFVDGATQTLTQDDIVRPEYSCCVSAADYLGKILEIGIVTEVVNVDGTVTTTRYNPHCMCSVEFTRDCPPT